MQAFRVHNHDTPPRLDEIGKPVPKRGEALIRIAACGLNFADLLMIRGSYQAIPPLPATLGMELSGTVEALGEAAEGPPPGTRVAVHAGHGGLAEYGAFPVGKILPIPDSMPFETAAGFLVAYGTSHLGLTRRARLAAGERLVVLGASGGVGLAAVEIGRALGAEVVAVARGPEKLAVAQEAGADRLIDSESADLRAELKAMGGVDVVYDAVGGDLGAAALRACRPEGRVLLVGFASGEVPKIAANHLLVKNVEVIGYYWGAYGEFAPELLTASLHELTRWYDAGRLHPHIGQIFPLDQAGAALDALAGRGSSGKIVVTMP